MLAPRTRLVLEGQGYHLLCLLALLAALYGASHLAGFRDGELLGLGTPTWVVLAVGNAIAHQVYVWLCWRTEPLVREGIFRLTPNAMYVFGFLVLWSPAIYFRSVAALCVAAFSHLYIWVHCFSTERPDMRRIYATGVSR